MMGFPSKDDPRKRAEPFISGEAGNEGMNAVEVAGIPWLGLTQELEVLRYLQEFTTAA